MPIYEYHCKNCKYKFDLLQKMSEIKFFDCLSVAMKMKYLYAKEVLKCMKRYLIPKCLPVVEGIRHVVGSLHLVISHHVNNFMKA